VGDTLGVTQEGGEAGGGDDGKHRSRAGGGGGLSPSLERILQHRGAVATPNRQNRDSGTGGTRRGGKGGGPVLDWR
jgi:hypothetical protein